MLIAMLWALALAAGELPPAEQRGPQLGKALPTFNVPDQHGRTRSFTDLRGPNGLLLILVQSADW